MEICCVDKSIVILCLFKVGIIEIFDVLDVMILIIGNVVGVDVSLCG